MFIECECLLLNVYIQWSNAKQKKHRAAGVIGQNKKNSMLLTTAVPCCTFWGLLLNTFSSKVGLTLGNIGHRMIEIGGFRVSLSKGIACLTLPDHAMATDGIWQI